MQPFDNAYYTNNGDGKYSTLAFDRYHPVNNPAVTQPRLTTTSAANNIVISDFWYRDAGFFRLKNLEVSYTFNNNPLSIAQNIKLYARCNNLFVIAKEKDLDPEVPASGVTNYPLFRTIIGGISIHF